MRKLISVEKSWEVVGYGINQRGACNRDGSLGSYDHQFRTYEEALEYEEAITKCGYGNTLWGICEVYLRDCLEEDSKFYTKLRKKERKGWA